MDFKNIRVTEVLRIDDVELYHTKKDKAVCLQKGSLLLLYSEEHNWHILKINEWNYGLNKDIPLLVSDREENMIRAYVLADVEGYFVIKVASGRYADLDRLDAIFKQNTQFAYKEGVDGHGLPIEVDNGTIKIKRIVSDSSAQAQNEPWTLAHTIYTGGKSAKGMMLNTAEVISVGLGKFGNYLQSNVLPKQEEKKINPGTMKKMNWLNSATGTVNSMSTFYIKGLMSLSNSIAQKIEAKFEKKKFEKEVEKIQHEHEKNMTQRREETRFTGSVAHAAIHAGIGLWHGMAEALDIIR